MLKALQIQELVKGGEGYNVDFKRSVPSKVKEISDEVASFANAAGGYVLIGVDNNNQIIGAEIDNNKRSAIQDTIGEISPALRCEFYPVDVEGKQVWVIDVPSGKDKPYITGGVIYVREGANCQKLRSAEEIRAFFAECAKIFYDAIPCRWFNIDKDIEPRNLQTFMEMANLSDTLPLRRLFESLELLTEEGIAKNATALFFGREPEHKFPHAIIRCLRFKGLDKVHIIDDKTFGSPLYQQYINALSWIESKLEVEYIIKGTGPREEIWEIPLDDSETLSLIKVYYPQIFALKEIEILRFMALFYKDLSEPKTLKEQIFRMYQDVIYEHYNYTYTPVQVGIASGIAQNRVFSFSAPTSTGKSYLIMNLIRDCDTDVVVVVPSRALINEYYSKLCNLIPDKSVNILTFVEKVNTAHANKNVFIVTPERCREIFKYANDFNIGLFLFDEAQLSNEENLRGMYFDNIIRRCHDKFKNAKLVFAQPFIENPASQIERNNLGNEQTDFRRYKHRNVGQLYLTYDNSEFFHFGINKEIMGSRKIKCNFDPILKCIKEEGSVLFYVSKSKILSREFYQEFKPYISLCKKISDKRALDLISRIQMYTGGKTDYSRNYYSLFIDLLSYGIVVHHGSMPLEARLVVENFTKSGFCRICFATSTLEQGINMPFDIVFLDRLEASDPIGVKNLIGRAGRSSESPEFDYGCVVIRSSGMTKFRKLMNTEDRLSSKSMLDEEKLEDDDLEEIKQELNDGSYDDYLNLPQSKLQRLSDDESDQLISQLLDYLFYKNKFIPSEIVISNGERWKNMIESFEKFYAHYIRRDLSKGEISILHTAIRILVWRVEAKTFKNMCQLRYQYVSRTKERSEYKRNKWEFKLEARFTAKYQEIPNKNCFAVPLFEYGTAASSVDYDSIIYDTYDYLDKLIGFKLSDILYAAFYKFFERHQEERALVAANYIKYGTDDPKEIWLLKYGVMFEDMETLKPHIQDINEQEIVVAQSYYELPPENQKVIERFVN